MSPLIKICGLTRPQDAQAAAAAGAQAVGFVFAPSPRRLTAPAARALAATLPRDLLRVGVFTAAGWSEMAAIARAVPLDVLQFPATRETPGDVALPGVRLWPSLGMTAAGPCHPECIAAWTPLAAAWLLDTAVAGLAGGTGASFPWQQARALAPRLGGLPVILAGGLTPDNVAAALTASGAQGVDVSSGVESAPGCKDAARLRDFVRAARGREHAA